MDNRKNRANRAKHVISQVFHPSPKFGLRLPRLFVIQALAQRQNLGSSVQIAHPQQEFHQTHAYNGEQTSQGRRWWAKGGRIGEKRRAETRKNGRRGGEWPPGKRAPCIPGSYEWMQIEAQGRFPSPWGALWCLDKHRTPRSTRRIPSRDQAAKSRTSWGGGDPWMRVCCKTVVDSREDTSR